MAIVTGEGSVVLSSNDDPITEMYVCDARRAAVMLAAIRRRTDASIFDGFERLLLEIHIGP
jgi:hypothetical protein